MSVLPKRTIPGNGVTIHLGLGFLHELDDVRFAFIKTMVKYPNGTTQSIFEKYIQLLPYVEKDIKLPNKEKTLKYLSRETPLLLIADFLNGGRNSKEKLIQVLSRLHTSRHFYTYFEVPKNAPLGKYEILTELYIDGKSYGSATKSDDHFFVEQIEIENIQQINKNEIFFTVVNKSEEQCPIKLIEFSDNGVNQKVFFLEGLEKKELSSNSDDCYLLYNEEREFLSLLKKEKKVIRNPHLQWIDKEDNGIKYYIFSKDDDDIAYTLEGESAKIWEISNGSLPVNSVKKVNDFLYKEMVDNGLLIEL